MKSRTFFICAGELSGDILGAGLIRALKTLYPDAQFLGIAGPQMIEAGCKPLYPLEVLSVMGILEVIPQIPRILYLRHQLIKYLLKNPPDAYIGIDSPDFNLPVEAKLKKHGIKTVHYVSPTVWAWRKGRTKTVKKSADLLLSVLPFEKAFYAPYGVPVEYVGHRSADVLPTLFTKDSARTLLNIERNVKVIALLPGSRASEIHFLGTLFLQTALACYEKDPSIQFIVAAAKPAIANRMRTLIAEGAYPFTVTVVENNTYAVIKAADVVLVTSGTATLEVMLLEKPMVVAYKMNRLTWELIRRIIQVKFCSIPNLLAGKAIVPELIQDDANPAQLSGALLEILENKAAQAQLRVEYQKIVLQLQCSADQNAARAVAKLLGD